MRRTRTRLRSGQAFGKGERQATRAVADLPGSARYGTARRPNCQRLFRIVERNREGSTAGGIRADSAFRTEQAFEARL